MSKKKKIENIMFSFDDFDPAGLKATAELTKDVTNFSLDAAKELYKVVGKPVLTEIGLGLRDKYRGWRMLQVVNTLEKAKGKLAFDPIKEKYIINPRVAFEIIENASVVSEDSLQEMWAGLFAASFGIDDDDENIIFIDILKRLTASQVRLLNYMCTKCEKRTNPSDLPKSIEDSFVYFAPIKLDYTDLENIMGTKNRLKIDTEFNLLDTLGLVSHRGNPSSNPIIYQVKSGMSTGFLPTITAIRLFIKGQGSKQTPIEYFKKDLEKYYYELTKDYLKYEGENILDYIYNFSKYGRENEKQVNYTIDEKTHVLEIRKDWPLFPKDLTSFLNSYVVHRNMYRLNQNYAIYHGREYIGNYLFSRGYVGLQKE